jgi:hypothetical protein
MKQILLNIESNSGKFNILQKITCFLLILRNKHYYHYFYHEIQSYFHFIVVQKTFR